MEQQSQQSQQSQQKQCRCTGDCMNCHPNQRQFCASQFTYNSMLMIENMQGTLSSMQGAIDELKSKMDAMQGNEANIFDPVKSNQSDEPGESHLTDTAQDG